jgi:hypothetical protein
VPAIGIPLDATIGDFSGERGEPVPPFPKYLPTDEEDLRIAG